MQQTYNGMKVPTQIDPRLIISAFDNEIDQQKVEDFTVILKLDMLGHNFPEIAGFPHIIDENDLSKEFLCGDPVTEEYIGKLAWMVTDGHHRSLAAIAAQLPYFPTTLDYNTITDEKDFNNFNS